MTRTAPTMPTATATIEQAEAVATLVTLAYRVEDFFIDGDRTSTAA